MEMLEAREIRWGSIERCLRAHLQATLGECQNEQA